MMCGYYDIVMCDYYNIMLCGHYETMLFVIMMYDYEDIIIQLTMMP